MNDLGIYLTVLSLVIYIVLLEHSRDLEPQWLWRVLRFACLGLTFAGLRLFRAGIKKEVMEEIRKQQHADGSGI